MKYFLLILILPLEAAAIGPITAKNAAQMADLRNTINFSVYDQIAGEAKLGGYYINLPKDCSKYKQLKSSGYDLLTVNTGKRIVCSVSW